MDFSHRKSFNWRICYRALVEFDGDERNIPLDRLKNINDLNADDPELAWMMAKIAVKECTVVRTGRQVVTISESDLNALACERLGRGQTGALPF